MKIDTKVAVIAGIIVIGTGLKLFWHEWGWNTPHNHEADMEARKVVQSAQYEALTRQLQTNRDEWWCDEQDEYLDDLLALKDKGDGSAALDQEIREQRVKMDAQACHRFDKD